MYDLVATLLIAGKEPSSLQILLLEYVMCCVWMSTGIT